MTIVNDAMKSVLYTDTHSLASHFAKGPIIDQLIHVLFMYIYIYIYLRRFYIRCFYHEMG